MVNNSEATLFLEAVVTALGSKLASRGFESQPLRQDLEKGDKLYWVRPYSWKIDMVTLWLDKRAPVALDPSLEIYLPLEESEESDSDPSIRNHFHGQGIGGVLGRSKSYYFPNFFGTLLPRRALAYARRIVRDVLCALPWFEKYASPQECLRKLRAGETKFGFNRGRLVQTIEEHLLRHSETQNSSGGIRLRGREH